MSSIFNKVSLWLIIFGLILLNYANFPYHYLIPSLALILGILIAALQQDQAIYHVSQIWASRVLSYAIILLGFGFNLTNILQAGIAGLGYTVISISITLILGLCLGYFLNNNGKVSTLISVGTAICGGSAIAAISPIIRANPQQAAIAIGSIFLLNALGLIIFPYLGHYLHLNQYQFGLFSALALHDTSSVVGSCIAYGKQSIVVGTTVKLVRALWIIPLSLIIAIIYAKIQGKETHPKPIKKPWFILWFIAASLFITLMPSLYGLGQALKHLGESLFIVALFLIGYTVSLANLKAIGFKVLIQAILLWLIVVTMVILSLKLNWLN